MTQLEKKNIPYNLMKWSVWAFKIIPYFVHIHLLFSVVLYSISSSMETVAVLCIGCHSECFVAKCEIKQFLYGMRTSGAEDAKHIVPMWAFRSSLIIHEMKSLNLIEFLLQRLFTMLNCYWVSNKVINKIRFYRWMHIEPD